VHRWSLIRRASRELALWSLLLLVTVAYTREPPPHSSSNVVLARASEDTPGGYPEHLPVRKWQLPNDTTVVSVVGTVHINRKGKILDPAVGDLIQVGDWVQVKPNSLLALKWSGGLITLTDRDGEWFEFVQSAIPPAADHPPQLDCDGVPPPCILNPPKAGTVLPGTTTPYPVDDSQAALSRAGMSALSLYEDGRYFDLDNLIARYSKLQDRVNDGKFKLSGIDDFLSLVSERRTLEALQTDLDRWRAVNPKSSGAALLEAKYWIRLAWQARGRGFANTVSPEGWRLFYERLDHATKTLAESESYAASNPLWYSLSLQAKRDAGATISEEFALYRRGIHAFPEFFPLHFSMIQVLLPRWGGSNEAIDAFIESVVKRSPPSLKVQMYTRLWWYTDQVSYIDVNIFRDMGVSWSRMKEGFESLRNSYPESIRLPTNYASFACRAGDLTTYIRLRSELADKINMFAQMAFPENESLGVCDDRAAGKHT